MATIYNSTLQSQSISVTQAAPIDIRTVVQTVDDLFNWNDDTFGSYIYHGMLVAVVKNNNSFTDPGNGLYYLPRRQDIQYLFDPSINSVIQPIVDDVSANCVCGKSNTDGWRKIATLADLNYPASSGYYILQMVADGSGGYSMQWTSITPTSNDNGKVLTATYNSGGASIGWSTVSGGSSSNDYPAEQGNWVLHIDDQGDPSWVEESASGAGIFINNISTVSDVNADDRNVPGVNGTTFRKTLSNDGEVIAVEDPNGVYPPGNEDTPFKLMLNYDKIGNIIVNGGDADNPEMSEINIEYQEKTSHNVLADWTIYRDEDSYLFISLDATVWLDSVKYSIDSVSPSSVTTTGNNTPDGVLVSALLAGSDYANNGDKIIVYVEEVPVWEPVVRTHPGVLSSGTVTMPDNANSDSFDWDDDTGFPSIKTLSTTAPSGTSTEQTREDEKYYYLENSPIAASASTTPSILCVLRIDDDFQDPSQDTDLDVVTELAVWDSILGDWIVLDKYSLGARKPLTYYYYNTVTGLTNDVNVKYVALFLIGSSSSYTGTFRIKISQK